MIEGVFFGDLQDCDDFILKETIVNYEGTAHCGRPVLCNYCHFKNRCDYKTDMFNLMVKKNKWYELNLGQVQFKINDKTYIFEYNKNANTFLYLKNLVEGVDYLRISRNNEGYYNIGSFIIVPKNSKIKLNKNYHEFSTIISKFNLYFPMPWKMRELYNSSLDYNELFIQLKLIKIRG